MTKRNKHWYATAVAFVESKDEEEFFSSRYFYYKYYTLDELKKMYEEKWLRKSQNSSRQAER